MSHEASLWAWNQDVDGIAKLVLLAIADGASNETFVAWPSAGFLARKCGVDERTVRRHIDALIDSGHVVRLRRRSHAGRYGTYEVQLPVHQRTICPVVEEAPPDNVPAGPPDNLPATTGQSARAESVIEPVSKKHTSSQATPPAPSEPEGVGYAEGTDRLCRWLALHIGRHLGSPPPKITDRWRKDMDLLLRRGPATWSAPHALGVEEVKFAIDFTFEHLAVPGPGPGYFCWAAQLRSPAALRRHWDDIKRLWKATQREAV